MSRCVYACRDIFMTSAHIDSPVALVLALCDVVLITILCVGVDSM